MSLSNPLLAVDRARVSKLLIKDSEMTDLFDLLVKRGLKLPVFKYDLTTDRYILEKPGEINFEGTEEEIVRKISRLYSLSKLSIEEKGVVTLFMTFGVLKWNDPGFKTPYLSAPVVMVPCEFEKNKHTNQVSRINFFGEGIQFNPVLELLFREKYDLPLPQIEEIDSKNFNEIIEHLGNLKTQFTIWKVIPQCWIISLNPEMFVLYSDLGKMMQNTEALTHPLINAFSGVLSLSKSSTESVSSVPLVPILRADSSQRKILEMVREGENVVIHGPPGTGKSQTIANIIADAVAREKTVLFVSAKKAALDVVYNRLKNAGLGRFCLEIHSTRKSKQELMFDLKRTIDLLQNFQDVEQPADLLKQFEHLKNNLNNLLNSLHRTDHPLGMSIYDAISRLEGLKDYPVIHSLHLSSIAEISKERFEKILQLMEKLEQLADVYNESQHPWKGFKFSENILSYPLKVIEMLEYVKMNLENMKQMLEKTGFTDIGSLCFEDIQKILHLLKSLKNVDVLPGRWFQVEIEELSTLREIVEILRKRKVLMKKYFQHTEKSIEEMTEILQPVERFSRSWLRILNPSYWKWKKFVNRNLRYPHNFEEIQRLYEISKNLIDTEIKYNDLKEKIPDQEFSFDEYRTKELEEIDFALIKLDIALGIRKKLPINIIKNDLILTRVSKDLISRAIEILEDTQLKKYMEDLNRLWPDGFIDEKTLQKTPVDEIIRKIDHLKANESKLHEWIQLQETLESLEKMDLKTFIQSVEKEHVKNIRRIFEKSFYKQWIDNVCTLDKNLRDFSSERYEQDILTLEKVEELLRKRWVQYVKSLLAQRFRTILADTNYSQQIHILMRETQKKRRHKPIRKFLLEISDILRFIKPCILMSPLSVSSFLDLDKFINYFDIVIFDEASQLRTPEAIPAVVRGKQIIVAGDPKQLPPTNFFKSYYELEDDEDEREPLDSFLDECIALPHAFKQGYLRWHYRSRDERLIAFSNHYFYGENPMITFPSPKSRSSDQGIKLVYVENGTWDRARRRVNTMEALKVVDIIIEHFQKHPDRSIGVVTMNTSQSDLIENLLQKRLMEYPHLMNVIFKESDEPFFIKSLENVQGDERDTIIISIGYARTPSGELFYNFGPLNNEGGWRRLNVLITRARYQIILVTSLRSEDLSRANPENRGIITLRNYLKYAEQNCKLEFSESHEKPDDIISASIAQQLNDMGFLTDTSIGMGLCQVSVGIRDFEDPGRYKIGIIHDGKNHAMIQDVIDREVLKFKVLESLGWKLKRLWTIEWYRDSEKVLKSIIESLKINERYRPSQTRSNNL